MEPTEAGKGRCQCVGGGTDPTRNTETLLRSKRIRQKGGFRLDMRLEEVGGVPNPKTFGVVRL